MKTARPFGLADKKGLQVFFVWPASGIVGTSKRGIHEHACKHIGSTVGWPAQMVPQPLSPLIMGIVIPETPLTGTSQWKQMWEFGDYEPRRATRHILGTGWPSQSGAQRRGTP